jgi:addiction module HigA family antidote
MIFDTKMKKLKNIHPGEILKEEFLDEMEISAYKLAKDLKIPQTRISEIVKGKRRISADTALRLSLYFNNSAKFWIGLQYDFDIEEALKKGKKSFKEINQFVRITA